MSNPDTVLSPEQKTANVGRLLFSAGSRLLGRGAAKAAPKGLGYAAPMAIEGAAQLGTRSGLGSGLRSGIKSGLGKAPDVGRKMLRWEKGTKFGPKQLASIAFPNLGVRGNAGRTAALGTYGYIEGSRAYKELGQAAQSMRDMRQIMSDSGVSPEVLAELDRYGTRRGIIAGLIRDRGGWTANLVGGPSETQMGRDLDSLAGTMARSQVARSLTHSWDKKLKPHEIGNPVGALITRAAMARAGKSIDTESSTTKMESFVNSHPEIKQKITSWMDKMKSYYEAIPDYGGPPAPPTTQ